MKDPIDKWLEANSPSFMPVEREERETYSPADKPKEQQLTEQQRWDNAARSMGWLHLVGMTKENTGPTFADILRAAEEIDTTMPNKTKP